MIYLTDIIAWVLVHVGALYFVTESAIFSPIRRLLTYGLKPNGLAVALLYCAGCCGFWCGLLEGWMGLTIFCPPEERLLGDALALPRVLTDQFSLVVLTGFAGMGLGAWWGGSRQAQIGLMFEIEQSWKFKETRDDDARKSATRSSREPGSGDGTEDDRPNGDA